MRQGRRAAVGRVRQPSEPAQGRHYSLAIFDLDGTLAHSFPWFLRNVNEVADRFRFRRVVEGEVEMLRHASTRDILAHLEVPRWKLPLIARHMRRLKTEQA